MKKFLTLVVMLFAVNASALSIVSQDAWVVYANAPGYTTDFLLTYPHQPTVQAGESTFTLPNEEFELSTCCYPMHVTMHPLDIVLKKHAEQVQKTGVGVIQVKLSGLTEINTLLTYDRTNPDKNDKNFGKREFGYLVIPALYKAFTSVNDEFTVWGAINDEETTTDIVFFNVDPDGRTNAVRIFVSEGSNSFPPEMVSCPPGFTFYRLAAKTTSAAKVVIRAGTGAGPELQDFNLLGFAAIGKSGAPRVVPFKK